SVQVTDRLPAGLTTSTARSGSLSQGTVSASSASTQSITLIWKLGGLRRGASASLSFSVTPTVAGTFTNTAHVVSLATHDPVAANNKGSASTTVSSPSGSVVRIGTT